MNLSGFKKLKETKEMVTMGHPMGHEIKIAKKQLSALQRKQIEKLPLHMADGGVVEAKDDSGEDVADEANQAATPPVAPVDQTGGATGTWDKPAPQTVVPTTQPIVQPETVRAPATVMSPAVDVGAAFQQGLGAIKEQQDVSSALAKKDAQIAQNDIDAKSALQDSVQQNLQDFKKHRDDFAQYIADHPIDPKHYQENMGVGQKVATAIGLLLGGFQGGFNKTGVNPAAQWLNEQVNKDLEGQRARQDQQKTVLGANQELYHDEVLANNAARINMNDIYDRKIQQAAAQLGTPAAKAAADAKSAEYKLQNSQLLQNSAIRASAAEALKRGGGGLDPITLGNAGFMHPEQATKEQASLDKQKQSIDTVKNIYSQLAKEQTAQNFTTYSARRVAALQAQLAPLIQSEDPSKRLTPDVYQKLIEPFFVKTSDSANVVLAKQQGMLNLVKQAHAGETPNFARLAPAGLPNYNVMPAETKTVNGITYRRGSNGQAIPVK